MKYRKIFKIFVSIISDEMLQNLKNFKILFKNYEKFQTISEFIYL